MFKLFKKSEKEGGLDKVKIRYGGCLGCFSNNSSRCYRVILANIVTVYDMTETPVSYTLTTHRIITKGAGDWSPRQLRTLWLDSNSFFDGMWVVDGHVYHRLLMCSFDLKILSPRSLSKHLLIYVSMQRTELEEPVKNQHMKS